MSRSSTWPGAPRDIITVLAKAPRPGQVKTRLCPPLDPLQAADLYAEMLADVLEATHDFATEASFEPVLSVYPASARMEMAGLVPSSFRVVAQCGFGLSERMAWAVDESLASGASKVLLRGSDNPALSRRILQSAVDALDEADLVVSPDQDGGYGLIGLRGPWAEVFNHPMSTDTVLEETLAHAQRLGLSVHRLESSFDLDRNCDLDRLLEAAVSEELDSCGRTVQWIRSYREAH